ncbi:Flagellar basal-body rod protein FlgG [Gimesia alba]|uniref:Flagellar basal-body rod protein FlgG n=1 Tax=Gimesia alba TaxID=2527973 RepID=A0A517RN54_9PLAN|nr:flagellar hook-basal body complex protein [Gimesia alba]QDT45252.1 Flagellar basal-body rod protein FlgG [Gimesia alba]
MRKNFERIIFAVSVCVLSGVLFIQGVLYLRDLGFADEASTLTAAIDGSSAKAPNELAVAETNECPFPIDQTLIPVELALAEENNEPAVSDEFTADGPAINGPALEAPGRIEENSIPELEKSGPSLPLFTKPSQEFPQTPGPLMPPLNAEPLSNSKKHSNSKEDQITRSIIREHLPHASEEELQIWFEELQGVPHKVASDLLSIRKLLQPKSAMKIPEEKWEQPLRGFEGTAPQQPVSSSNGGHSDETGFIGFSSKADRDELMQRLKPTVDALRLSRDVIVNNIANAGTIGFKRSYVEFEALPYEYLETPASEESDSAPPIAVGMGSQVLQTRVSQTNGELIKTERALDLAIEGSGFLQVKLGELTAFTRSGRLMFDGERRLCIRGSQINYLILPEITLPAEAHSVQISETGVVTAVVSEDKKEQEQTVGKISLVCFTDASELFPRESCLFVATPRSGEPRVVSPGAKGAGLVRAGVLETSNVSIPEELEALSLIKQRLDALKTVYSTEPQEPVRADLGLPADRIARPGDQRLQRGSRPILK